jgi:tetratricopeptide (TPR) repeat protein
MAGCGGDACILELWFGAAGLKMGKWNEAARTRRRAATPGLKAMILLPVVGLAACNGMKPMTAGMPEMQASMTAMPVSMSMASVMPAAPMPTPGLAPRERFALAINLLQQGNAAQADVELKAYLAVMPNSGPAQKMVTQIETPIATLYPAEYFTVTVGPTDSLSSIAGVYLGDVLAFYGLARYNNIDVPSRVATGLNIKIPKTPQTLAAQANRNMMQQASVAPPPPMPNAGKLPPTPPPAATTTPPGRPHDSWAVIRDAVAAKNYDAAVKEAEANKLNPDKAQAALLASAYINNARAIKAGNATLAESQAVRAGQLYLEVADRSEDAIEPLQFAVAINGGDAKAQTLLSTAKAKTEDFYYRAGVTAFQKQDLDGAISAWDKVLAIDPNHKNAQLNRAQAVELKQNLQKLNGK